jgi:hypothetical protein
MTATQGKGWGFDLITCFGSITILELCIYCCNVLPGCGRISQCLCLFRCSPGRTNRYFRNNLELDNQIQHHHSKTSKQCALDGVGYSLFVAQLTNVFHSSHAEPSTPGDQTGMTTHKIRTIYYDTHSKGFMYKAATKTLPPLHVLIRTTHSGLCTTDVHAKHKGCGLGHEGVGLVERLGKGVNNLSLGQRVGWGWLHSVSSPVAPEHTKSNILTRR